MRLAAGLRKPRFSVLGGYFAGTVESVGADVRRFSVGDAVFGSSGMGFGAYAEKLRVPESRTLIRMPGNMDFVDAAAVPLGGLNALHFLRLAELQAGERILINGSGGSIGAHAVMIAKAMGAHVTAVDAGRKAEGLLRLGADRFVDYETQDFAAEGATYDVMFDMVAGSSYSRCMSVLSPTGRYLSGNPRLLTMLRAFWTTRFTGRTARFRFAGETVEELETLRAMFESGQIRSIVDTVWPLRKAADAHRQVEAEDRVGAVVLQVT